MKKMFLLAAVPAAVSITVAAPAVAQSGDRAAVAAADTSARSAVSADFDRNGTIFSADGHRIGRIDHVRSVNGNPAIASVIFSGRFVNIPVATLITKDGRLMTSLSVADINRR